MKYLLKVIHQDKEVSSYPSNGIPDIGDVVIVGDQGFNVKERAWDLRKTDTQIVFLEVEE